MDLTKQVLDRNKLWDNKTKNENLEFEKKYVEKYISNWEKNILNGFVPNYSKKKNEIQEEKESFKKVPRKDQKQGRGKGKK